jgi:preprotein translocase SecE subunit
MARDRKRAKQRQRRQQRGGARGPAAKRREAHPTQPEDEVRAPDPLEHASADVELAEVAERGGLSAEPPEDDAGEVFEDELQPVPDGGGDGAGGPGGGAQESDGGAPEPAGRPAPERTRAGGGRFINFLRACVAELRRVQWPDRRQVTQATSVVLGFVIIAGAYLGLLDAIWSRVVDAIL